MKKYKRYSKPKVGDNVILFGKCFRIDDIIQGYARISGFIELKDLKTKKELVDLGYEARRIK